MEIIYVGSEKLVVEKIKEDETGRYYIMNIKIEGDKNKFKIRIELDENNHAVSSSEVV